MVYSINSGLVTSVIGVICVVAFAAMPTNFVWLSFFWIMGKCYVNSFLALLNSREMLRERVAKGAWHLSNMATPPSIQPSTSASELHSKIRTKSLRPDAGIAVSVETITEYGPRFPHRDDMSAIKEDEVHQLTIKDDTASTAEAIGEV
ncbi:hypothetical protein GSI_15552 [Ganoderma sinense ZZ0214-1]|uniref:DUF6534 domain-containing protein n=1 Tax=Ganoderma sinense ZZ0214-1 TaxID=1077348 RepID=A0A2G8RMW5_9APHY|nr:hypothetical protein GSI_15552 [Ganoderma sinense ZZ0214-1]